MQLPVNQEESAELSAGKRVAACGRNRRKCNYCKIPAVYKCVSLLVMRELIGERGILSQPRHLEHSLPAECHDDHTPAPVVNKLDRPVGVNAVNSR